MNNVVYNADCLPAMREYPDGYFGLCICDPPYGLGIEKMTFMRSGDKPYRSSGSAAKSRDYRHTVWDIRPTKEYFDELFRISKAQIIWGG